MPKIYTKTGDNGETALLGGKRVSKSDERIDLYGDVDELNSYLGLLITSLNKNEFKDDVLLLRRTQSELFILGSLLACEVNNRQRFNLQDLDQSFIKELESRIDFLDATLKPLSNFILPGSGATNAQMHILRTITRRVERKLVRFDEANIADEVAGAVIFLNRLSDYFFVLSRYVTSINKEKEILWSPTNSI